MCKMWNRDLGRKFIEILNNDNNQMNEKVLLNKRKTEDYIGEKIDMFNIFAQNIDWWYP